MKEKNCREHKLNCGESGFGGTLNLTKSKGVAKRLWGMFAALCVTAAAIGGTFGLQSASSVSASAYSTSSSADWTSTEDLLKTTASSSDGVTFNLDVLESVAAAGGYSSLKTMMVDALKGTTKNASDFLTNPDTKEAITKGIEIKFGGLYWTPVYLTTDRANNVVLDLLLSSSTTVSADGTTTNETATYNNWSGYQGTDTPYDYYDFYEFSYPSNMYSTSYVRSLLTGSQYAINTTGKYRASDDSVVKLTEGTQSAKWSTFLANLGLTGDADESNYTYLDTPSQVAYQETEKVGDNNKVSAISGGYALLNEAYGEIPASSYKGNYSNFYDKTANEKDRYTDWSTDYLWLPSSSEMGYNNYATMISDYGTNTKYKYDGIWKLTEAQLCNDGGTWYRSGDIGSTAIACCAAADGKSTIYNDITTVYGVRPAIHLNLGKVTGYKFVSSPVNYKTTYAAKNIDMTSTLNKSSWFDGTIMDVTAPANVRDAGKYTYTVTIPEDNDYYFEDGTKTATFTLTINKAPLVINVIVDENNEVTYECVGLKGSDTKPDVIYKYTNVETGEEVADITTAEPGEYKVTAELRDAKNGNYVQNGGEPGIYIIQEKTENGKDVVAKPILDPDTFVYSGKAVNIEDYLAVLYLEREKLSGTTSATDAGSYSVTVSLNETTDEGLPIYWADGANDDTREPLTYNYTITKAPISVKVTVGDDGTINIECTGVVEGEDDPEIKLIYISKETGEEVDPENLEPGVYTLKPVLADENGNYEITDWDADDYEIDTEIVDNKLLLAEPVLIKDSFVYTGTAINIKNYFEALNLAYEDIAGDLNPVNVGNYAVEVSIKDDAEAYWSDFADDDNCGALHYTFRITPAPLTVVVHRDEEGNITIDCTGMVNGEPQPELEIIYKDSEGNVVTDIDNLDPDRYTVIAVIKDENSNYEITDLTHATFDVIEKVVDGNTIILKPELTQTEFPYTGDVIDIIKYFSDLDLEFEEVVGDLQPKDAGEYTVTVKFKDGTENVYWAGEEGDNQPLVFTFTILPAEIADEWLNDSEGIPEIAEDDDKVTYIYYDKDGEPLVNDDGQPATKDDLVPGETYQVIAVIKDEYKDNYVFDSTGTDRTEKKTFTVLAPAELDVPTLENANLIYNGEEQTVVLVGYESEYMEYDPSELTQVDSNKYVITISLKDGAYAEWADGLPGTQREITFEIGKAPIDALWEFATAYPDLLELPDDASVAYTIRDLNGNALDAAHIVEGQQYIVTATLSDDSYANYYFAETGSDSVLTFFMYYPGDELTSGNTFEEMFPLWALLIIVLALVGGAVAWSKVASNVRENSEYKKEEKRNGNK